MTSLNNHMAEWVRRGEKGQWRKWEWNGNGRQENWRIWGLGGSRRRVKEGRRWKLEGLEKSK